MKLRILSIHEQGNADKEYVWLEVLEDCDVGEYGLADTTYTSDGAVSNKLRHFYWFPDKAVRKGQRVVLQTKSGTNDQYKTQDGKTVHRFFWGLKSAVWNNDGDAAVLFHIDEWKPTAA